MNKPMAIPTIAEILTKEFMEPMNISAYELAQKVQIPVSQIQDILHGRRKITADISLRLAKLFGVSEQYFLNMQNDIDMRNSEIMPEPIMPSQLPKRKINLPAIAKYAEENHICVAELSEAEKEALIQKFTDVYILKPPCFRGGFCVYKNSKCRNDG